MVSPTLVRRPFTGPKDDTEISTAPLPDKASPDNVSRPILLRPSDNQLLGPVHVLGGEAVTAAGELSPNVEPSP